MPLKATKPPYPLSPRYMRLHTKPMKFHGTIACDNLCLTWFGPCTSSLNIPRMMHGIPTTRCTAKRVHVELHLQNWTTELQHFFTGQASGFDGGLASLASLGFSSRYLQYVLVESTLTRFANQHQVCMGTFFTGHIQCGVYFTQHHGGSFAHLAPTKFVLAWQQTPQTKS